MLRPGSDQVQSGLDLVLSGFVAVIPELCESKNGDCDHFCEVVNGKAQCSCADGYFLSVDEKSCDSNGWPFSFYSIGLIT